MKHILFQITDFPLNVSLIILVNGIYATEIYKNVDVFFSFFSAFIYLVQLLA